MSNTSLWIYLDDNNLKVQVNQMSTSSTSNISIIIFLSRVLGEIIYNFLYVVLKIVWES
jgi:hypothetical protein